MVHHICFDMVSNTLLLTYRSSTLQMFFKIGVLKNFANFEEKHQCWFLFLIRSCNFIRPATLLKRNSNTGVFLREIFKSTYFENISGRLQKLFLKISQNSQTKTCARVSILIKLQGWLYWKKVPTLVSSYKFSEMCKISFFTETLRPTASMSLIIPDNQTKWTNRLGLETVTLMMDIETYLISLPTSAWQQTSFNNTCNIFLL